MNSDWGETRLLVVALVGLTALSAVVLSEVLYTVVFAITVAYTLFPFRKLLVHRGFSRRVATGAITGVAALAVVAAVVPAAYVLYQRRSALIGIARALPATIPIEIGEFSYLIRTRPLTTAASDVLQDAALSIASAATVLSLKGLLFAIVVYGLLARPGSFRTVAVGLVPVEFHDALERYHERIQATLAGIYLVQAATAAATGVAAYVVFALLGYEAALTLAIVAGLLQFVPVVGPSVVIVTLAAVDVVNGDVTRATTVLIVGLVVVGFLPDAIVRPRLASLAGELPMTLYFVGFVGGVLTIGPLGFVLGPLAVGLLVETVQLLSTAPGVEEAADADDVIQSDRDAGIE
ncbi:MULTISPECIES: AI-2E family transporter [Halolamina]|uniref:Predicted PurR-regulated permease PerM n=1 Tax=Halolamina pelagica TaxID=699431 RepID=A0A1I5SL00_9EURY|nr:MULTISPECIES: AI-2E family transporter [Halolamina]NHX37012.1 AI-2E family transporter [Halolamina sp. R1-12]SFP71321.1 Predicted PurR-regulated permease PerM [Halolamina pelagica]